jgi:hypothetical protein
MIIASAAAGAALIVVAVLVLAVRRRRRRGLEKRAAQNRASLALPSFADLQVEGADAGAITMMPEGMSAVEMNVAGQQASMQSMAGEVATGGATGTGPEATADGDGWLRAFSSFNIEYGGDDTTVPGDTNTADDTDDAFW